MHANGNNQNKILWWITGALLGPAFLATQGMLLNVVFTGAQRVAALETQYQRIEKDLDAIHGKLDRLLQR